MNEVEQLKQFLDSWLYDAADSELDEALIMSAQDLLYECNETLRQHGDNGAFALTTIEEFMNIISK